MSKIYFYKLTADNDGAPCVRPGLLSLAICKPMIRSAAEEGDVIIGFAADSLHEDNRLIYVARVTKKLTNGDYYKRAEYAGRGDCIYEWQGGRFAVRNDAKHHGTLEDLVHDLGEHPGYSRANTLLSERFAYFGAAGSDDYKNEFPTVAQAVEDLGRGHRVHHESQLLEELEELVKRSHALDGAHIQGKASSNPCGGVSHHQADCAVVQRKPLC